MDKDKRMWRTLLRVEGANHADPFVDFIIPAWSVRDVVRVAARKIPDDILAAIRGGRQRVYAKVNIGAKHDDELMLDSWDAPGAHEQWCSECDGLGRRVGWPHTSCQTCKGTGRVTQAEHDAYHGA